MSTENTSPAGAAQVLAPANDDPMAARPTEAAVHDHAAEPSEIVPEVAVDPVLTAPAEVAEPEPVATPFGFVYPSASLTPAPVDPVPAAPTPISLAPLAAAIEAAAPKPSSSAPKTAPAAYPALPEEVAPPERELGGGSGGGAKGPAAPRPEPEPVPVPLKAKDEIFDIGKTVAYALAIALVLRVLLFQPFTIPSASMEPNLYEGDYLVVSKWDYGWSRHSFPFSFPPFAGRILDRQAHRGDIVVFKFPGNMKLDYIKRVIGVPGDQIQVRNDQLYINGEATKDVPIGQVKSLLHDYDKGVDFDHATELQETLPGGKTFKIQDFETDGRADNTPVFTVPAGHYFVMGDNRDNSEDSRFSQDVGGVGFVPEENLEGKAQMILFSWYPGASILKPWTWVTKLRPSRFFKPLQ
jgi:signal peptidase I